MRGVVKSGEALLHVVRALAFTSNELERRIWSEGVTGFYSHFHKLILISKLRSERDQGEQRWRLGDPVGGY